MLVNGMYLINYIENNVNIDKNILDALRYELTTKMYFYGDNFKYHLEKNEQFITKNKIRSIAKENLLVFKGILAKFHKEAKNTNKNILFHSYFNTSVLARKLFAMDYNVYSPFWINNPALFDFKSYGLYKNIRNTLKNDDFKCLISIEFIEKINAFKNILIKKYKKIGVNALIVSSDMPFFENISIQVFKELKKPSFVFLHGLPGIYNNIDNNRADYLIVWGEKIKENYIKAGVDKNKIFVSGNPKYLDFKPNKIKFDLENILIVSNSRPMLSGQHGYDSILSDRNNSISYLYSIKNVLTKLGVKTVTWRVHVAENAMWYLKYLDQDFFKIDNRTLEDSINKSSLVIGPVSTVFLETVYRSVNYIFYEPTVNGLGLDNRPLVSPADGLDTRVPTAKNEEELLCLLKDKATVDTRIFSDYIKPDFDLNFLKHLL